MEWYTELANWVGWPKVVLLLLAIGGLGIWIYESRIKLKNEKIELLESQLKESQNNAPEVLVKKYVEMKEILKNQIENSTSSNEQDVERIKELQEQLAIVNTQLGNQKGIVDEAQKLLEDSTFPRGGRYHQDIATDIQNTITNHKCIFVPIEMENIGDEIVFRIKEKHPYKLKVVFPGMNHMYLFVLDNEDRRIGEVYNPYLGLYYKDYYETLLTYLRDLPYEHAGRGQDQGGDVMIFPKSEYFAVDQFKPNIFYIRVPTQ
jgi:hypothetical protein